jgi:hypothetical protein
MSIQHRVRGLRAITSAVATIAAVAATFFVGATSAGAATAPAGLNTGCSAVAADAQGPTPVFLSWANPAFSPCVTDTKTLASATATVIPGLPGTATIATISAVTSRTSEGYDIFRHYVVRASSDIASLTVVGPGLVIRATGIHTDTTVVSGRTTFTESANSWIGSLTVNGVPVNVAKNVAVTIPLGLRTAIYLNQRELSDGLAYAAALRVSFPDYRYGLFVATSEAFEYWQPLT